MRRLLTCCVVAFAVAGCRDAGSVSAPLDPPELLITESPSPYREVTGGAVTATLPDNWYPRLAANVDDARHGLVAGPTPEAWSDARTPSEGFAAVWVDGTRVGVPSDYYYLAASGPALGALTASPTCRGRHRVIVNHRPEYAKGTIGSPGDYVARGGGTCSIGRHPMRWAYFVAAPGFGPVRELGIPSSNLYVVVAMMRDSRQAPQVLGRLLKSTEFGGTSVSELIKAAQDDTRTARVV